MTDVDVGSGALLGGFGVPGFQTELIEFPDQCEQPARFRWRGAVLLLRGGPGANGFPEKITGPSLPGRAAATAAARLLFVIASRRFNPASLSGPLVAGMRGATRRLFI